MTVLSIPLLLPGKLRWGWCATAPGVESFTRAGPWGQLSFHWVIRWSASGSLRL